MKKLSHALTAATLLGLGLFSLGLFDFGLLGIGKMAEVRAATLPTAIKTYLTAKQTNGIPSRVEEENFTCSEQVYLVIETGVTASTSAPASNHQLSVLWHNPQGKIEHRTHYDFTHHQGGSRIWAWLRLSGAPGATLARLFDPAYGMDEFIGTWRAEVKIDQEKLAPLTFEVLC